MVDKLPNEILHEILRYIEEDTKTLFSLLLVNRLWCENSVLTLWKNPFKLENNYKILLPLLSCYYNKNNKEEPDIKYLKELNLINRSTFNYPSFIKQLEIRNMLSMIFTLAENFNLNNSSIIQIIWNMIINNSKIETLTINTKNSISSRDLHWPLKTFKSFFKITETKICFSIMKKLTFKLNLPDLSILSDLIECTNGRIKEIELEISNSKSNITYPNLDNVINLIKSQKKLEKFTYKDLSRNLSIQPIITELKDHSCTMKILNFEQRCDIDVDDLFSNLKIFYNIQELSFRNFTFEGNHELLTNIKFSQLKSLSLDGITSRNQRYLAYISEPIINLIQNHSDNLEHLNIKMTDVIMKDTFKTISLCCSNLQSFSCSTSDQNDMTFIYSIFKNNPHLTSIDLCIIFPIRNSFLTKFANEIPNTINYIAIGYSILRKENIKTFLQGLNCKKLKSFKFNWQNQKNVNISEIVKNVTKDKDWGNRCTFEECELGLANYQHTCIFKWE
ncbi:hypothetical protein C1645_816028 [Glomus cerebriforme]|uniref:F-box domain-containing protein n=1 Tax=Glomus cerebriforme TaxID=658196 RepID=A0A397TLI2_9GLOM|nr:hypothetical protein C1645_816028 [Glomus cerebriforme]